MNQHNRYSDNSPSRYKLIEPELVNLPKEGVVAEFGCASGETLNEIRSVRTDVRAIGFDLALLKDLKFEAYQCDMNDFNFEGYKHILENVDIFLMLDVLEHLNNPWRFLEECILHSKTGASIIITCPNFRSLRLLKAYLKGEMPLDEFGFFDKTHLRWLTPESLTKGIESTNYYHNFRYLKSGKLTFKIIQSIWPSRLCSQFLLTLKIDKH